MTDAEIIKALEQEIDLAEYVDSDYCTNTAVSLIKAALDLINRQKAEIERLQKENNQFADIGKMYSEIKSEAIKEFAERFLSIAQRVDRDDVDELILIKRDLFDSFVKKEMGVIRNDIRRSN